MQDILSGNKVTGAISQTESITHTLQETCAEMHVVRFMVQTIFLCDSICVCTAT